MKIRSVIVIVLMACLSLNMAAQEMTDAQKTAAEAAAAIDKTKTEAQKAKPSNWTLGLRTQINVGQTSLTNWAAGGDNTVSLQAFIDANADYKVENMFWNNRLQLDYGFLYASSKPILQKSTDRIYLESKWGYTGGGKAEHLYFSANYNLRSQFSNTYEYPTPTKKKNGDPMEEGYKPGREDWLAAKKLKSGFFAPAYTNLALGLDYTPFPWLSINFAPLTGGFVVVSNEELRSAYSMPLKKKYKDTPTDELPVDGSQLRNARFELGSQFKADVKVSYKTFGYSTQLVLFTDYLFKRQKLSPEAGKSGQNQNIRLNWDNRFDWKLAKYFSFTFITNLIYDGNVMIVQEKDKVKFPKGKRRCQFKESLSFGFTYTIANKK